MGALRPEDTRYLRELSGSEMRGKEWPRFILITGIDGSGKTTLSKLLVAELKQTGIRYYYKHANEVPVLMRLVKIAIKYLFLRRHNAFADYGSYVRRKEQISKKYPILARIYRILLILDYIPQVFLKVSLPLLIGHRLVVDRYVYDVIANLGFNLNYSLQEYAGDVELLYRFFPRPDIVILLDTDESVAYSRKTDIPAVDFLRERRRIYAHFAEIESMKVIKGEGPPEEIARRVLAQVLGSGDCG